ncbi:UNVERIFIED_CONTAM: hypothetical protein Sradi_1013900 [Sesamum radiatum]|uniref:Uncharacterized protein n=1 Tax=Sesamum radiatum TaxID=300843 RepID=A0AAW2V5X4_SESRA
MLVLGGRASSVMIAKKHDDTSSDDVEPGPLFPEDTAETSAGNPSLAAVAAAAHLHSSLCDYCKEAALFVEFGLVWSERCMYV